MSIYFVNQDHPRQIYSEVFVLKMLKHRFVAIAAHHLTNQFECQAQNRSIAIAHLGHVNLRAIAIHKKDPFTADGI